MSVQTLELVNPLTLHVCMDVTALSLSGRRVICSSPPPALTHTHTHTHPCAPEPKKHHTCHKTHNLTNHNNRIDQSRTCTHEGGCPKRATHGLPGVHDHKSAPFCGNHASEGMEDVVSKRCAEPGCSVRNPRFGEPGARKNVRGDGDSDGNAWSVGL